MSTLATIKRTPQKSLNIFPQPGQHMTIIGQTGSGKSTLANIILQQAMMIRYPVMILDTKGEELFNHLNIYEKFKDIKRAHDVIVYRPNPHELQDEKLLDDFLYLGYSRSDDCIVYIDELTSLGDSPKAKPGLLSLYSRGRKHIIHGKPVRTTTIGGTQAPFFVPRVVYRQSRSFCVFRLNDSRDRDVVARFTHPALKDNPIGKTNGKHDFWWFLDNEPEPRVVTLRIK